jgi:two-component system OmpR family sensor kinase
MTSTHSLRTRLLGFILGAIMVAALVQAVTAYRTALNEADAIFDRHMQKMAWSLRSGTPLINDEPNSALNADRENEDFFVQMWSASGVPIFQSAAHRRLRQPGPAGFSYVQSLDNRTYRLFVIATPQQVIQVAQDMAARRDMARSLAVHTVLPALLMAPLLMLAVWLVVSRSLAPVASVRTQVARRKADDLHPVNDQGLPDEVRPLIQELNLLFERLRQAFEAQQHFVADAAHELRSPLAALKIQLQGLQRAGDDAARELAIKRLAAGIDRAGHLVDQLLALARQQAGPATAGEQQLVVLDQVALVALSDAMPAAQARRIDLGVHQADNTVVRGDAEALRTLARNLLDNAIKYTPPGGTVDLSVLADLGGAVLVVEDSGPGIPPRDRARVLDRFYRVSGSGAEGSGLGLAIVKAIADRHGAQVQLDESARLGGLRAQVRFAPGR